MDQDFIEHIRNYMIDKYNCHSIIIYGSYANGDFTDESDVDVVCFCDEIEEHNDTSFMGHRQLDAWIYRTEKMKDVEEFLHVRDGQVLFDRNGLCNDFLEKINEVYNKGPKPLF